MPPDASATLPLPFPLDLDLTLGPLQRGPSDPTIRFEPDGVWRAARLPDPLFVAARAEPATQHSSHL